MYIERKSFSVAYKLFISLLSGLGLFILVQQFGTASWRLFAAWTLAFSTVYFFISAFILAASRKRLSGENPFPMLEGMVLIAFLTVAVTAIVCYIADVPFYSIEGWAAGLVYASLPIFVLTDWLFFAKKGRFRAIDPFYWLAFPLVYASMMVASADFSPTNIIDLRYPLPFLNYGENGLLDMLGWLTVFGVLILAAGYFVVMIDALTSGQISKHIVLPRVKTIVVEEVVEEEKSNS